MKHDGYFANERIDKALDQISRTRAPISLREAMTHMAYDYAEHVTRWRSLDDEKPIAGDMVEVHFRNPGDTFQHSIMKWDDDTEHNLRSTLKQYIKWRPTAMPESE